MSSTILNITIDCADPQRIAGFWAGLTGWAVPQPNSEYAVGEFVTPSPRTDHIRPHRVRSGHSDMAI